MTKRSVTLVSTATMALLLTVAPSAVRSQDQKQEPVVSQQERPAAEKAPQKPAGETTPVPGQLSVPEARPQQPGQAIVPAEEGGAEPSIAQASPESGKGVYIVKQGDTLWDISNSFLKDPFLWPFIWKANPSIVNPDLIYPGTELAMPSLAPVERAMQEPAVEQELKELPGEPPAAEKPAEVKPEEKAEAEPVEEAPPSKLILPEEGPVPIMDKYSMLNAGFVNQDDTKDIIIGSKEEKTFLSYDDIAYVVLPSRKGAALGEKFLIFEQLDNVRHPITGKNYGRLIKVLGILELTETPPKPKTSSKSKTKPKAKSNPVYTARIILSFDGIPIKSKLTPYQEPSLIYYNQLQPKAKDISGYVLEVIDTRTLNAKTDIVYLDKGSAEGVEAGDRFLVYNKPENPSHPKTLIGETQVFLVKQHTSTAVVRYSSDIVSKGNQIVFKK